jgi:hypothetical protein
LELEAVVRRYLSVHLEIDESFFEAVQLVKEKARPMCRFPMVRIEFERSLIA